MNRKMENACNLYMEGIRDGRAREAVTKYTGSRYTQHSTGVRDGVEGFVEFFEPFIDRNPVRDIRIVRGLVDGPYVFLHVFQELNNGESRWVTTDFFDTDSEDRIVEHWDVIAEYTGANPSGHTPVDGQAEIADPDKTEENKRLVEDLIRNVLMTGEGADDLDRYISRDTFIRHGRDSLDGIDSFRERISSPGRKILYGEPVLLVGQGNFVAALCRMTETVGSASRDYAQVDLFRLRDGKIVEHWENREPVPEHDVNSGKF